MAKSKTSKPEAAKSDLSKTKQNGVTKPTKAAGKEEKQSKKTAKAPPPSESESDAESGSSDESDASASDSASGDESDVTSASDSEVESKAAKSKPAKVNGSKPAANGTKKSHESDEGSDASESDDDSSESDSDAGDKKPAAVNGAKSATKSKKDDASDSSDSSGSDGSDDEDEEMTAPTAAVKRKAEADEEPTAKKAKTNGGSEPKSVFVGNISFNVDEEWLAREFSTYGEVTGARIITDRDSGRSKGYGYVDFVNGDDAEAAVKKMHDFELDGRMLRCDLATGRPDRGSQNPRDKFDSRQKSFGDTVSEPSETLWCGNLSFDVTAEVLRENFEEYGSITRISLPTHPDSGQLKGFGYVAFSNVEEAKAAFEAWKGQPLMGRPIRLDYSTPKPEGGFGGGRGGGGRGGGRDFGGRGGGGRGGGFRGGRGGDRGGRGGRGGGGRGRGSSTNRGGIGDFSGSKMTF